MTRAGRALLVCLWTPRGWNPAVLGLWLCALPAPAFAQVDPNSGIDFVTVGAPGNLAWPGNGTEGDMAVGRGSVDYSYRIGRTEVTTSQWAEFMNAAFDRPADDRLPFVDYPQPWGASSVTPNNPGGRRWTVPAGREMYAVGGISWRTAAMYCNWLTNNKSSDRSAFMNGAYDVSTFGNAQIGFSDQLAHNPGAPYWIPTWDEWLKAAHYDPDKNGPGQGGWWLYSNGSDQVPAYGPPGVHVNPLYPWGPNPNGPLAEANAGWWTQFPGYSPFDVPLEAYPDTLSPWGLMDVAGGTREWTEYVFNVNGVWPSYRGLDGSAWASGDAGIIDQISTGLAGDFPSVPGFDYGLRVASIIPGISSCGPLAIWVIWLSGQRRRKERSDVRQIPRAVSRPPRRS